MRLSMGTENRSPAPDPSALDARAIRRSFGRAARTYADAARLQQEVSANLDRRLGDFDVRPAAILDAGCGTGFALPALAARYPRARLVALDLALPMLQAAQDTGRRILDAASNRAPRSEAPATVEYVCGDIAGLPFAAHAFDLVWSNLAVQWIGDLPRAFAQMRRVLRPGGFLAFTTFGPATLQELRAAFADADRHTHVSRFVDVESVAAMLAAAGFDDPIVEVERSALSYADGIAMMRDLRAIGATNATQGRPRGLTGRARWRRMLDALETMRRNGRLPATFEVIYARAWKRSAEAMAAEAPAASSAHRGESQESPEGAPR